ncbi:MAG: hydrogenase formation protein HypD [Euryarchaeota archaeon]|nr:hydrogenase formation protein HypD [Euryarchaeota archaeon]
MKPGALSEKILGGIFREAEKIGKEVKFMDVCGTHEDTINRGGIRSLLPDNVKVFAGPGCPVCITPVEDIVRMMEIAKQKDMVITTFGDMYRIPTPAGSFADFKAQGYDVRVVYSIFDSYKLALKTDRLVVHFSPGFETTTAPAAGMLAEAEREKIENFKIYSVHRLTPPAVEFLLKAGTKFDGLITPGHVSAIIGVRGWESLTSQYRVPQVISGFEPLDMLASIYMLLKMLNEGRVEIENEYTRVVRYEGNESAQAAINEFFEVRDAKWRALGTIPESGLFLKKEYEHLEIRNEVDAEVPDMPDLERGCRCGEVLRGLILPDKCPLFGRVCTPRTPVGPCMVSYEGTCNIFYKYSGLR